MRCLWPLTLLLAGAFAAAPSGRAPEPSLSGAELYRRTLPAVAWVQAAGSGKGTGWVVDRRRRWLVTCHHVVGDNDAVEVIFPLRHGRVFLAERQAYVTDLPALRASGHAVRGRVLRRSAAVDLALVELASLPPGAGELRLGADPQPGDRAHVVGNRYDLDVLWAHGSGAVRQVQRQRDGYFNSGRRFGRGARVVVAQVPINEGDSGGPLVNGRGEVVGVAAAVSWETGGLGLFIAASEVRAFLGAAPASEENPAGDLAARDVYARGLRSAALVQYAGGSRFGGVLVDKRRKLLLTTAEAVSREKTVDVTFPVRQRGEAVADARFYAGQRDLLRQKGALVTGVVLTTDARRNLALLELEGVPAGAEEVTFADGAVAPGDALHVVSHPHRLEALWAYAAAAVRQLARANLGQTTDGPDPAVVVVQAPLAEGEGGGPLLDGRGRLVGVVSGKVGPQQQVAFALALAEVRAFLAEARPASAPASAAELVARGRLFLKARLPDRASRDFTAALALDPKHAHAHVERARARLLQGDAGGALADCDRALELDARLPSAYACRAAAWCAKGAPAKAVADADRALKLDRGCAPAYAARAQARLLRGDADRALADADEAVWLDRELAAAYLVRGRAHAAKEAHGKAVDDFTQALRLDPGLAEALTDRAEVHWARSDVDRAFADYDGALRLAPRDARALHGRGRARRARGEHAKALADLDAALRLDPALAPAYVDRGGERLRRGRLADGVADLARAVRLRPALANEALAEVERHGAEMDPADACELYTRALEALAPLLKGTPALPKAVAAAAREPDAKKRAAALRALVAKVRGRL